jgi:hypothetical protein
VTQLPDYKPTFPTWNQKPLSEVAAFLFPELTLLDLSLVDCGVCPMLPLSLLSGFSEEHFLLHSCLWHRLQHCIAVHSTIQV